MLNQENVKKLFKLEDGFGQVIKETKLDINFLFKLRFHLERDEKKLRSLSPNSMHKKLLTERFYHIFDLSLTFCSSATQTLEISKIYLIFMHLKI